MDSQRTRVPDDRQSGAAIVVVVLAVSALAALSAGLLVTSMTDARRQVAERTDVATRYATQAGLTQALYQLRRGEPGDVGTRESPVAWGAWRVWVAAAKLGGNMYRLQGTGLHARGGDSLELLARRTPDPASVWGAFGDEYLRMGENAMVDSYDSRLGTHESQATGTHNALMYAAEEGHVGSNGPVELDANAAVWGNATTGPNGSTSVGGNARVAGSITPSTASVPMPAIRVPEIPVSKDLSVRSNQTIGPGDIAYGDVTIDGARTLTIVGPARIVVENFTNEHDGRLLADTAGGPVELWVRRNFVLDSNASMRAVDYDPTALRVNLLGDDVSGSHEVRMGSGGRYYGTLLAPDARVVIQGGFQLYGSCVARSIELNGNAFLHFDKALLDAEVFGPATWEVVADRRIAFQGGPGSRDSAGR